MTKNRIIGAIAALSLLAVPAVAVAHGSGDDRGKSSSRDHHHQHHGKKAKKKTRTATGTITSFANGELTVTLLNGKSFTADVKRHTVILCKSAPIVPATTARNGDDNGKGRRGHHDDPATTTAPPTVTAPASTTTPSTTVPAPTTGNADHHHGHGARCGTAALVAGTSVATAKLSLQGGSATWKKIVLLK